MSTAVLLLRAGLAILRTELGRRLGTVAVLAVVLVAGVSVLYDHADPVTSPPFEAAAAVATTHAPARPAAAPAPKPRSAAAAKRLRPDQVAVAWYAERRGIAAAKVQALQQQPIGRTRVRVLVMARLGQDRLDTAVVVVRRAGSRWVAG